MKQTEMKHMAVKDIVVAENFRTSMDKTALKELTESVRALGVLEPVLVRKMPNGEYKLVAGARRVAAAKEAGRKEIPASIMESTDEEANLIQAVENLHRENLNPIDEAEQFSKLLKVNEGAKDLVSVVDKSLKYIYRSMALLELPKVVQDMIRTGKLKPAHGHILLRVPEKRLPTVLEYIKGEIGYNGEMTISRLQSHVDKILGRQMADAIFDKTECGKCPCYTKNQSLLFDENNDGLCDNADCYKKKTLEHRKKLAEEASEKAYKDVKYLGVRGGSYDYNTKRTTIGTFVVVDEDLQKSASLKEIFKKNKDKFGFVIDPESNKPKLVITNEELIKELKLTKKQGKETDWEGERYADNAARVALITEFMVKSPKGEKAEVGMLLDIASDIDEELIVNAAGMGEPAEKALKKMSREELIKLVWLHNAIRGTFLANVEGYIPKAKAIALAAKKEAQATWPAIKKAKEDEAAAEAAKNKEKTKGKKAEKKEETPEDPDETGE